jgi:hypothetical protein
MQMRERGLIEREERIEEEKEGETETEIEEKEVTPSIQPI